MKAMQRIVALKAQLKRERQSYLKYKAYSAFILKEQTATLSKLIESHVYLYSSSHKLMQCFIEMPSPAEATLAVGLIDETFKEQQILIDLAKDTHDQLLYYLFSGHWQAPPLTTCAMQYIFNQVLNEYAVYQQYIEQPITADFNFIGDSLLAQEMIRCLLDNAIEAMTKGRPGRIEVWIDLDENYHYLHIRDDAIGLVDQEGIFAPFYSTKGQTGLGLFAAQEIMHAFHGEISCQQSTAEYAWFTLQFPKMKEA